MNGSVVMPRTAGIESSANIRSVQSITSSTTIAGVISQRLPRRTKKAPESYECPDMNGLSHRNRGFFSGWTSCSFDTASLTYNARKLVWTDVAAWHWAAAASDDREHVGLSLMLFWPQSQAAHYVAIDDDYNADPPGWENAFVQSGAEDWTANSSGDYLRAWSSAPQGVGWVGTGYTRQVGAYVPHFAEWRRGRDERGVVRFEHK